MKIKWVVLGALASLGILSYLIVTDIGPVVREISHLHREYLLAALVCALGSYAMIGLALWDVLALIGFRLSFPEVIGIAFVSTSANYFISSMGVSGFALKAHLLRKRNVPFGATVTASVVSTALMYAVLGAIIVQGLLYLALRMRGARIQVLEGVLGFLLLGLTSAPFLLFMFHEKVRSHVVRKIFHWMNLASFQLAKREVPKEDFEAFERQLNEGLDSIRASKGRLTRVFGYTCLDWVLTMGVLYFGFLAVGERLSVGHLSAGFAVGQATTLIPVLPGGLGAMEASMAAVFSRFGTDWDKALVAVLVYRVAYYMLPGILSVFLLWGLKMSEPKWVEETANETIPEELRLAEGSPRPRGEG